MCMRVCLLTPQATMAAPMDKGSIEQLKEFYLQRQIGILSNFYRLALVLIGPKMGKNWPKNRKWPLARNGEKMAQKWRKNGIWGHFSIFSPFLGHFFPISGRGPFSIFWPIFSHFWLSTRFPFYTRRPDSQCQCVCVLSYCANARPT